MLEQEAKIFRAKAKNPEKAHDDVAVLIRADAAGADRYGSRTDREMSRAKFTKFSLKASRKQK